MWIIGILGASVLLCCGTCGGLGYFTIQNEHREVADEVIAQFRDHPVVMEQLGGLDRVQGNLAKGLNDDESDMVFDAHGPKGSATLHVSQVFGETFSVVLRKDGQDWELMEDDEPASDAMMDEESELEESPAP